MIRKIHDLVGTARMVWKSKFWILVPVLLGIAASQFAIRKATPIYSASTKVMVEPQKVPATYVKSTITSKIQDRLKTLEQQIQQRSNMERLIYEVDLYSEFRDKDPMERLVARARKGLKVRVDRNQIVEITFTDTNPVKAAQAANQLAELFIEENLRLRERQAENTTAFLETELEKTRQDLEEQEARVSEFRLRNAGSLPTQREANFAAIAQLERQLDLNRTRTEDAELRQFLLMREEVNSMSGAVAPKSAQATRLEQLELELQSLKAQYTSKHPDVIRLETEIEAIRKQESLEVEVEEPTEPSVPSTNNTRDLELANLNVELSRLKSERENLIGGIAGYQRRLEDTPRVEQELLVLTRDYNNLRESYQGLLAKQIEARMAEQLERDQQSEQFKILDRASPPAAPTYPNKFMFTVVGLMIGAALGTVLVMVRDQLDDTFPDEDALANAFPGIETVIAIPDISPESTQASETEDAGKQQMA